MHEMSQIGDDLIFPSGYSEHHRIDLTHLGAF